MKDEQRTANPVRQRYSRWRRVAPLSKLLRMTKKNPFPGMNPFIEQRWRDAHTMLVAYIRDALQEQLAEDLVAGAEEEVVSIGLEEKDKRFRPDVGVWEMHESSARGSAVAGPIRAPQASTPTCIIVDEEVERWVEIRDASGKLITVIELLSPSNKVDEAAREMFRRKRRTLMSGGVNIVEIDLVRSGGSLFPADVVETKRRKGACYGVCVFRAARSGELEFYAIALREPLPTLSIPLRPNEREVALELQPLLNRCHERGRYHLLRYDLNLEPPLSESDRDWIQQVLREHQLAG
jgi:hypothetical protein